MSLLEGSAAPSAKKTLTAAEKEAAQQAYLQNYQVPILSASEVTKLLQRASNKPYGRAGHSVGDGNSLFVPGAQMLGDDFGGDLGADKAVKGLNIKSINANILTGAALFGVYKEGKNTFTSSSGKTATNANFAAAAKAAGVDITGMNKQQAYDAINAKGQGFYAITSRATGTNNPVNPTTGNAANHFFSLYKKDGDKLVPAINEQTGMPVVKPFSSTWHQPFDDFNSFVQSSIPAIALGASVFLPGIGQGLSSAISGTTLGASLGAIGTSALSGALLSGGMAALTGGDIGKALLTGGVGGGLSVATSDIATSVLGADNIAKLSVITGIKPEQLSKMIAGGVATGLVSTITDPDRIALNVITSIASNFASDKAKDFIKENVDTKNINALSNAAGSIADVATTALVRGENVGDAIANSATKIAINAGKDVAANQPANQTFPIREDIGKEKETALADLINLPKSSDDLSGDAKDIYNHYVSNGLDKDTALVLASSADPKFQNPELGTQLGDPTAGLTGGITLDKPTASDVPIDLPQVDFAPVIQGDKTLHAIEVIAPAEKPMTGAEQLQENPVDINQTNKDILDTILIKPPTTDKTVNVEEVNTDVDITPFTSDPDVMDHYVTEAINGLGDIGIKNPTKIQIDTAALQLLQSDANTIFNPTTSQPTTPIKVDEDKLPVVDETEPIIDITKGLEDINTDDLDLDQVIKDIISNPTEVDTTDATVVDDTKLPIVNETKPTTDIVDVLKNTDTDKKDVNEVIKDILTNPTNVDTNETKETTDTTGTTNTTDATGKTDTTDTVDTTGATDTVDTIIGGNAEDTLNLEDILKDPNAEVTDGKIDVDTDVLAGTGENTITGGTGEDTVTGGTTEDELTDTGLVDENADVTDGEVKVDADTLAGTGDDTVIGGTTEDELTDTTLPKDENAGVTDGEVEVDLDLLDPDGDILNPDDIPEDPNQKPYDETDPDVDPEILDPTKDKAAADKVVADRYAAEKADQNRRLSAYESLLGIGSLPSGTPTQVKPDLADVFYFGKDFSTPMQSISKTGELVQSPYKGLSVSQKGKEIASSGGTGENDVYNLLNEIMSKGNKTSLNDLLEILGGS